MLLSLSSVFVPIIIYIMLQYIRLLLIMPFMLRALEYIYNFFLLLSLSWMPSLCFYWLIFISPSRLASVTSCLNHSVGLNVASAHCTYCYLSTYHIILTFSGYLGCVFGTIAIHIWILNTYHSNHLSIENKYIFVRLNQHELLREYFVISVYILI